MSHLALLNAADPAAARCLLEECLGEMPEREEQIVRLREGLGLDEPRQLEEVAAKMGMTREHVRRVEEDVWERLHCDRRLYELLAPVLVTASPSRLLG